MNRTVSKYLLLGIERLRGERVDRYLPEMEANQQLPPQALKALQADKLSRLLADVGKPNPYFRRKYGGVREPQDLRELPLLTKAELRENAKELVTPVHARKVTMCKTSGSTGEPLKFFRDGEVFARTLASVYRAHRWYGIDVGAREAMLWAFRPGGFPSCECAREIFC